MDLHQCVHKLYGETREGKRRKVEGWTGWITKIINANSAVVTWVGGSTSLEDFSNLVPWRHGSPEPLMPEKYRGKV